MDDIRRQDMKIFAKELMSLSNVLITLLALGISFPVALNATNSTIFAGAIAVAILSVSTFNAWTRSERKRWLSPRMSALWDGANDRMKRFEEVLKKMRRDQVADLREMPATIRGVSRSIYYALRRADIISHEVQLSEKNLYAQPPVWGGTPSDPQSRELYRLADKNIAEYRSQFAGVMAGVQRTEAQSAVFMTTLDSLRMKMLGYRLVGRSPELHSQDFLEALAEARAQLQSIDTALEELDLGHYPKTIAVVPPAPPEDVLRQRIGH